MPDCERCAERLARNAALFKALRQAESELLHYPPYYCHSCTAALQIIQAALAEAMAIDDA